MPPPDYELYKGEEVRVIPGFPNYLATSKARIWSEVTEKWLKQVQVHNETYVVCLGFGKKQHKTVTISAIMALTFGVPYKKRGRRPD